MRIHLADVPWIMGAAPVALAIVALRLLMASCL
jgi:hypothetical protein